MAWRCAEDERQVDVSKAEKEKAGRQNDKVKGVMRTQVTTVSRDTPLARLEEILVTTVGRVPVVEDDGRLLGIVTRTDLLRLRNYYGGELPRPSALGRFRRGGARVNRKRAGAAPARRAGRTGRLPAGTTRRPAARSSSPSFC